jgi:hypothetical protein
MHNLLQLMLSSFDYINYFLSLLPKMVENSQHDFVSPTRHFEFLICIPCNKTDTADRITVITVITSIYLFEKII